MSGQNQHAWGIAIARIAHELGIVENNERVFTEYESPTHDELSNLTKKVYQIVSLIVSCPDRFHHGNLVQFANAIGFSAQLTKLLLTFNESLTDDVFIRGDLIHEANDNWKLLEINVGTPIGGLIYASLPRLAGFSQHNDVLKSWAISIVKKYNIHGNVAFIEDQKYIEYVRRFVPIQAREIANLTGENASILSQNEVVLKENGLYSKIDDSKIDFILPLFSDQDFFENFNTYNDILDACKQGCVKSVMGPINRIIASKGALAYLYNLAESGFLTGIEKTLLETMVPYTTWLNPINIDQIKTSRTEWILKPSSGFCGKEVVIGLETTPLAWEAILESHCYNFPDKTYVVQRYVQNPSVGTVLTDKFGKIYNEQTKFIWGPFHIGSEYIGTFVRGNSFKSSAVINHFNGAEIGPIPYPNGVETR